MGFLGTDPGSHASECMSVYYFCASWLLSVFRHHLAPGITAASRPPWSYIGPLKTVESWKQEHYKPCYPQPWYSSQSPSLSSGGALSNSLKKPKKPQKILHKVAIWPLTFLSLVCCWPCVKRLHWNRLYYNYIISSHKFMSNSINTPD